MAEWLQPNPMPQGDLSLAKGGRRRANINEAEKCEKEAGCLEKFCDKKALPAHTTVQYSSLDQKGLI